MSLVPYGDSDDEEKEVKQNEIGESVQIVSNDDDKTDDNLKAKDRLVHTSLGIARSEPVQGDWLCFVFLPIPSDSELMEVLQKSRRFLTKQKLSSTSKIEQIEQSHISLTRPILLRQHECESLLAIVKDAIEQFKKDALQKTMSRILIAFSKFSLLLSENERRSFWVAEIGQGWDQIQRLTTILDNMIKGKIHSRKYYEQARFHSSFAHLDTDSTNDPHTNLTSTVQQLEQRYGTRLRACSPVSISQIGIAIGPKKHYLNL